MENNDKNIIASQLPKTATNCDAAGRANWQNLTDEDTDVR